MKKLQKATLRIFLLCMVITAVLMLTAVWTTMAEPDKGGPHPIMQYVFTFFIIGLASFLVWFTSMVLEIRDNLKK
jgi:hypothetical protein